MIVECPHCGMDNRSEARFCRYCGQPLVMAEASEPHLAEEEAPDQQPDLTTSPSEALTAGQMLHGRYRIQRVLTKTEGGLTYEAEDLLRCWNCRVVQTEEAPQYCEACGAEFVQLPLAYLHASQQAEDPLIEEDQDSFFEGGVLYRVEQPAPLPEVASPPAPLRLISGFQSHSGKVRDNNEDSLITLHLAGMCDQQCSPALGFFAIADGVGGAASGEIASQAAVRSLAHGVMQRIFDFEMVGASLPDEELLIVFRDIILAANQAILDLRSQMDDNDMGCTLTAALVRGAQVLVANVGDSRTYRLHQGKLCLVTQDHSVVARLVEQGLLQPEEVYTHFQRHMIYRSLGIQPNLEVDLFTLELEPGERLLLCSDGLWEMVRDGMMEEVLLERYDPQQASDRLVELANVAGGEDNVSVIVLNVQGQRSGM
jgi:serine/threonine protein phosphatase PrpC